MFRNSAVNTSALMSLLQPAVFSKSDEIEKQLVEINGKSLRSGQVLFLPVRK
jgi:hypothetical protein